MKRKWLNKITKTLGITTLVVTPSIVFVSSCAPQEQPGKIESLKISLDHNYVVKGETQKVIKTIEPASARNNPLVWKIDNPQDGVTISQDGEISVDNNFSLTYPIQIKVVATDPTNELVVSTLNFYAVPSGSSDLLGFIGGTISEIARDEITEKKINIVYKKDHYETEMPLDFFVSCDPKMTFLPLFKKNAPYLMKFHIVGHGDPSFKHSIDWNDGYVDNSLIDGIPRVKILNSDYRNEQIEVSFQCDSNIKLLINICVWQNPGIKSDTYVRYGGRTSEDDPHDITYTGVVSTYEATLYFDTKKFGIQSDKMEKIYVNRAPAEYLDYYFDIDTESMVEEEVQEALEGKIQVTSEFKVRAFDSYPYYQIDIKNVEFNPEVFKPEKFDRKPTQLFTIQGYDPLFPRQVAVIIRVYVDWLY